MKVMMNLKHLLCQNFRSHRTILTQRCQDGFLLCCCNAIPCEIPQSANSTAMPSPGLRFPL